MDVHSSVPGLGPLPRDLPRLVPAPPPVRARASSPTLSVVIVNYLHWNDTAGLLRQLRTSPALHDGRVEVVIVDNHSPPHPVIPRLRRLPGVSLRRWRRNRGFARAVNEGARLGEGEWILLLNPDLTLEPTFIERVMARAEELIAREPRAGIVGFSLRHEDGSQQLSTGRFPSLASTVLRMFLPRHRRKYSPPEHEDLPSRVDWVTGCCLLVRRSCWEDLGGLDPTFFLYYEDVDLCRRAQERGWSVWFDPQASAIHHRPLHVRAVPPHLRLITRHALLTYARKHWPGWQFQTLAAIIRIEAQARRLEAACRGDWERAALFNELAGITGEMAAGRTSTAGRRLVRLVWLREEQYAQTASVDCHPGPQPT